MVSEIVDPPERLPQLTPEEVAAIEAVEVAAVCSRDAQVPETVGMAPPVSVMSRAPLTSMLGTFVRMPPSRRSLSAARRTGSTGISYPLANGDVDFDSGQLGYGPQGYTPAAQRADWFTPSNLPPGTYTYFCRVHPFMRGVFRVRGTPAARTVNLPATKARVDRAGHAHVYAFCGGRQSGACEGTVSLRAGGGEVGSGEFTIPAGTTREVVVPLNSRGRYLLSRRGGRLPVTLIAAAADAAPVTHHVILRRR